MSGLFAIGALATLLVAGCSGTPAKSDSSSASPSTSSTASASDSSTAAPAPTTQAVEAACPYLDTEFVKGTIGQHLSKVTVTTVTPPTGPLPQCAFARPNGEVAVTVSSTTVTDAAQAMSLALQFAPDGNPVSAGEGGSVLVKKGGNETVLAAYKGTALLYVTINQESSLEATEIATQALSTL
ncbi:uncharacterized protein DUF2020 [Antricoccus suffuscus]|uniref:Uncharacterized protein DUF2020 n=2 Tax=Antricoccus suffuscus TaxID=1629062 RepID=A0A2T1A2I5_9ACTN|nr:uncharacterized protein DUF2020 [Antricoccus suffuscus]